MEIEGTTFGTITIDGKTYEHDVIIRLSGEVVKRKKKLSKKYYGTSHVLSKDEAKFVFEKDASSSFSARARWAMCIYRRKRRLILRKCAAKYYCHPRSDPGVQQVKCKEDRAFSRDLLKRVGGQGTRAFAHLYVAICHR
jgi:hypothetical protein